MSQKDLTARFFSTIKANKLLSMLVAFLLVQQLWIVNKNYTIDNLIEERTSLEEDIFDIQDQLALLEDSASDIKMFQDEMTKILKSFDHNYPRKFISERTEPSTDKSLSVKEQIKKAYQSLFKLSSSQKDLRKKNDALLARAVFIKNTINKTPSLYPVLKGRISSHFGYRKDPFTGIRKHHNGIDIAAVFNSPVLASADGEVIEVNNNSRKALGKYIVIRHAEGFITRYGHLNQYFVVVGDKVKRGEQIARVGQTGTRCRGPHLHLEISKNGKKLDPEEVLLKPGQKLGENIF
jgi:murein DD-endopeptidase MepM/ murein hydrolase activator NlpD